MRVLHVVESFGGGVADVISSLCAGMPQCQHRVLHGIRENDADYELTRQRFPSATTFDIWQHTTREISPLKDYKAAVFFYKYLKANQFDVVHLHSSKAGFIGRIVTALAGIDKVLYTSHGVSFIRKDVSELKITLFKQIERIANAFNGVVVACGPSEGERFLEIGIKPEFVSNGAVVKTLPEGVAKRPTFTVVTCGRFTEAKDPSKFNEIALALQDHNDIQFLWIGDGDLKHVITSENVEITGWVGKEELDELILKSHLYLSTSLWEGLPVSVLEAMINGLPLLLSQVNGNVDLVVDGLNGYSFSTVEQAVKRILQYKNSVELCVNHGIAGRAYATENFSLEQTIEKYYQLYRRLDKNER